jgi:hypothetical protein
MHICNQLLNNLSRNDILEMPVNERRFRLNMLIRDKHRREEQMEEARQSQTKNGSRTRKVSGDALKNMINSGNVPLV